MLTYEVAELVPPPGASSAAGISDAWDVNASGSAAGAAYVNRSGDGEVVLWTTPDAPRVLEPVPPGGVSIGINEGGDVVGALDWPNLALRPTED